MKPFPAAPHRNKFMLTGALARKGYDWWWHSFTARHAKTGEEKAFFIEYFICNPALGGDAPVFCDPESAARGGRPTYGLVKVGCWGADARQLHRYCGTHSITIGSGSLDITMADCRLSETAMTGSVSVSSSERDAHPEWASDAGRLVWDLRIDKKLHYSVGAGAGSLARALNLFEMYWHAEGIRTDYSGWLELDGERYIVEPASCYGYADKNWGENFTSPWLWISSCDLVSKTSGKRLDNSALEIGGGKPRILGIPLPDRLLAYLAYEGRGYDFNFSKVWQGADVTFAFKEGADDNVWSVIARNRNAVMEVDLSCAKAEMQLMRYQAPDGTRLHKRLWNGGTGTGEIRLFARKAGTVEPIDTIAIGHVGCEYGEYQRSEQE
ncbi:hypothetical protein ABID20_000849 [Rhizobium alvei]